MWDSMKYIMWKKDIKNRGCKDWFNENTIWNAKLWQCNKKGKTLYTSLRVPFDVTKAWIAPMGMHTMETIAKHQPRASAHGGYTYPL